MPAPVAFPRYSSEKLAFAIQEAAQDFRKPWRAWLGLETMADTRPYPWQSIKAMTRRQAEGWDDGYPIRPTSNLLNALIRAISRFLETPLEWSGQPTDEEKRDVIDHIKMLVARECGTLSQRRLREKPQPEWQTAYALRGGGSTFVRRMQVETIYEKWVPIPHSGGDKETQAFLDEVKEIVQGAVRAVEEQVKAGWHASLGEGLDTARRENKPVLIDMWATWCKNCLTMDKTTLVDAKVQLALSGYVRIKFQAESPDAAPAKDVMQRFGAVGLPTYVIVRAK